MNNLFNKRLLGEILVSNHGVKQEDVDTLLETSNGRLGSQLIAKKLISEDQLMQALADQFNIPYVDISKITIPQNLFDIFPANYAIQLRVLPYELNDNELMVAISSPDDILLKGKIESISGMPVKFALCTEELLQSTLQQNANAESELSDVSKSFKPVIVKENDDGNEEIIAFDTIDELMAPVVKLINTAIMDGLQKRASDIHIETYKDGIDIKYRIDGVLYTATEGLDTDYHNMLVSRIKIMSELDIAEKRVPQDGRFKLRIRSHDIDFRVSILPTVYGEDVVIRILDKSSVAESGEALSLDNLSLPTATLKRFRKAIREPYGMVLITGPTGSGKTTTLYASMAELNTGEDKMITIEDPVEYQLDGIIQIPVNEKKGLTFSKGLRSILRHDPDRIMVGEIRDSDTAQIAVQSALTGHLVFTTVHANNVFDVISRFSHLGIDVYSFVSSLNCVMAQRLVRNICINCKIEVNINEEMLELSGLDIDKFNNQTWFEGKGCNHCHGTGFHGRSAIAELLTVSPIMRDLIIERQPVVELRKLAKKEGMITLRQSAIDLALAGKTTLKEINRVTFVD